MRAHQVGPGSARSDWKATLDPGKSLPCSNSGGQRPIENDPKSGSTAGTNAQSVQQEATEQKK